MEIKKHATQEQLDQRRNKSWDQTIYRVKWECQYNISKFWDAAKAVIKGKFILLQAYLKKKQNKLDGKSQEPYDFTHMWDIKLKTNEQTR